LEYLKCSVNLRADLDFLKKRHYTSLIIRMARNEGI
jgi:hypothetical protein